jgi:assimilatory nitrate reductase catalytic subunit
MDAARHPTTLNTTCAYCGVGCGISASVTAEGIAIRGDAAHPANAGKLCVKGSALGETLGLEGRLLEPQIRTGGVLRAASWQEALETVAQGFRRVIDEHGPDAVAFYVSGQLLTEDYYVANKLMKGYIGSANIDTNSRLCMSSAVAGHKRAFGEDVVPGCYEDLEEADLVVLTGSNTAWCHPVLYQRIARAKAARPGMKVVVIDPRRTATCDIADLHLPVKPGTDVWLFNGLFSWLAREGHLDRGWVAAHADGLEAALAVADADPADVARACKVALPDLLAFYELFARTTKTVTAYSQGVNQSSAGTDKVNAIINCHLLTGRIGRPGMGPFSLTGQPNAMGGREVGGLANMLAAHMDLDNPGHRASVREFWASPLIAERPGLKAVDLFAAMERGEVKAVWIMGTNPVVSLPDADQARRALARCELVVASDVVAETDTNACAHVLLPALAWGEKDGTVTNSERRISRQRAFLPVPGKARADWDIICEVARRMGFAGFEYAGSHAIFDEHARLSAVRNKGERFFDLGWLAGMDRAAYDALEPVQWPAGQARVFGDGRFAHPDGRARFVPTPVRAPAHATDDEFPLVLNTGRVRDQWHTMTRTGRAATLAEHVPESFIDLHPQDALLCGVREGELARVRSRWGSMVARVRHGGGIARGGVFVPIHWSGPTASDARVGAVVNPAVDPVSGEPEFKHTPVTVEPFGVDWYAFVLSRGALPVEQLTHWTRVQGRSMVRHEMAGRGRLPDMAAWARSLLGAGEDADWLEYEDRSEGMYRAALLVEDRLEACVFVARRAGLPDRAWLAGLFDLPTLAPGERAALLAGQPLGGNADAGPIVCSCFGVRSGVIARVIREQKLDSVAAVTACCRAGGNCGSCIPEIRALIRSA